MQAVLNNSYKGRFAPSPTGPLHFGSLVAATGSYLQAKTNNGEWLLRIEDVDQPRTVPGSADGIIHSLDTCGFEWNGEISWQSRNTRYYEEAIDQLLAAGFGYPCTCSRTQIKKAATIGEEGAIYPGTCRHGHANIGKQHSIRLRTDSEPVGFDDLIHGHIEQNIEAEIGDFIIRRADGIHAYQLAVVVDDGRQGITEVVRGTDLLGSTARQVYLQQKLDLPTPSYLHLPLAVTRENLKLSKMSGARGIDLTHPGAEVWRSLEFLGQNPPAEMNNAPPSELWSWATDNWRIDTIPKHNIVVECNENICRISP